MLSFNKFLLDLINITSTTWDEKEVALYLYNFLKKNIDYDLLKLEEVEKDRYNLILVKWSPNLTLTSHMDVVPGKIFIWEDDKNIYWRWACDAKWQIVTQLYWLFEAIKMWIKDYACFYVIWEEVDSIWAYSIIKNKSLKWKYLLNWEPTSNKFTSVSSWVIECKIYAKWEKKHSSIKNIKSAIHYLIYDLNILLQKQDLDKYYLNIWSIRWWEVSNVSSDYAEAKICIRTNINSKNVLKKLFSKLSYAKMKILWQPVEPFIFYTPDMGINKSIDVNYCSDASIYKKKYNYIIQYGPWDIQFAHTNNEYIIKKEIELWIKDICNLFLSLK